MEAEIVGAIIGALALVSAGSLSAVVALLRRGNNKGNGNPNFSTLEMLARQQLEATKDQGRQQLEETKELGGKVDQVLLAVTEMKLVVGNCEAVRRVQRGG